MATVKEIIDGVMKAEGWDKYTNDPKDRGGATKWGITQTTARMYGYTGDIKNMTYDQAYAVYYQRFWLDPKFDEIDKRSHELAVAMFDYGVNSGQTKPIKAMQRALNSLNLEGKSFPDVNPDGVIGRMTLGALDAFLKQRGTAGAIVLLNMVKAIRSVFLLEITERCQSQEKWAYGWQTRAFK